MVSGATGIILSIIGLGLLLAKKKKSQLVLGLAFTGILLRDGWFLVDGRVLDLIPPLSLLLSTSLLGSYLVQWLLAYYANSKQWLI